MYKNVLVPLDGSELAECVLPHLDIIAGCGGIESINFYRVIKPFVPFGDTVGAGLSSADVAKIEKDNVTAAENYLKQITQKTKYPGVKIGWKVAGGYEADSIVDYAKKSGAELIIMSTHGRSGVSRWVMGSVADRVLRSACVPVMLVRAPGCIPGF
jgi:nucleotide-binding universal stress UspA family protein